MENPEIQSSTKSLESASAKQSLATRILARIKTNKISPKPRWQFLLKNYVVWSAGILSLIIGAAAVSVLIYLFKYNNWDIYDQTHKSLWEFFLLTLPYFWFVFLGLFVFVVYYNLKHTKHGYRYPLYAIILTPIALSVILGSGFFLIGWGEKIDNVLGRQAPLYNHLINRQLAFWFNPEEGRLAGIVVYLAEGGEEIFYLIDPAGDNWKISNRFDQRPDQRFPEFLKIGEPVNLVGRIIAEGEFQAAIIRPLMPGREFFKRPEIRDRHPECFTGNCLPPPVNFREEIN